MMLRSDRQRAIAKTVRRHNALFVGRAFAVPAFANINSPRILSPLGCGGAGEAGTNAVSPTLVLGSFHLTGVTHP